MSISVDFFDLNVQLNILNLMLKNDDTCAKMIKYLGTKHKYLKKVSIFQEQELQNIFDVICESWIDKAERPSITEVKQRIHSKYNEVERERTKKLLEKIYNKDLEESEYLRSELQEKIQKIRSLQIDQCFNDLIKKHGAGASTILKKLYEEVSSIDFSDKKAFKLSDTFSMQEEQSSESGFMITSGDKRLDNVLNGGIPRGSLVTLPAGTNTGKSMYCISWSGKVLDQIDPMTGLNLGLKVLYIPLEGTLSETNFRFLSNRTKRPLSEINNKKYSEDPKEHNEIEQGMREIAKEYDERLLIFPMTDFKVTIDDLYARLEEIYKDFKFDFLVVDYGQLLKTTVPQEKRHVMADVYQGLSAIASKFNCVVASPVQGTREAQKFQSEEYKKQAGGRLPVVRMEHISEAFEIARVSAFIITLNTSEEEMQRNEYRLYLDKSRTGMKGITFGCIVDFPRCNLHTGEYYDVNSGVRDASRLSDSLQDKDVDSIVKMNDNKEHVTKLVKLDDKKSKINDLDKLITKLEKEIVNLKEDNPFDVEEDGETAKKEAEIRKIQDDKIELETEYMNLFLSIYPEAKLSDIETYQRSFEEKDGKKKYEEDCLEIKNILDRYEIAQNLGLK